MATQKTTEAIVIKPIQMERVTIRIVGNSPLIEHAWSEKAKKMMLDAQMGKKKGKAKEAKNPVEDFIRSMYWITPMPTEFTMDAYYEAIENGARFGFPATAFKQAAMAAAYRRGLVKNQMGLRGAFFIECDDRDLVEIKLDEAPEMREDMVKVGKGTADIRYRGEFRKWHADLRIIYDAGGEYDLEALVNIINAGGMTVGVGEWRPEKDGDFGRYHVEAR